VGRGHPREAAAGQTPLLEAVLSKVTARDGRRVPAPDAASPATGGHGSGGAAAESLTAPA